MRPLLRAFYSTATKGSLFKYQNDLPSLPVPTLEHTLDLYKRSVAALYPHGLNDPGFIKYSEVIDQFGQKEGPELQTRLAQFAQGKRNWLSHIWDNYAYLGYRDAVVPFVSYFYSHKDLNTAIGKDQLLKASAISYQVLKFMEAVEAETLQPEMTKTHPLCMEGFKWMFNGCRVPAKPTDLSFRSNPEDNRFMIVLSNGYVYRFDHHQDGQLASPSAIYTGLSSIYKDSHSKPVCPTPVGILTSANRDVWTENYARLSSNPVNMRSLELIQQSSFVLCLDDSFPSTIAEKSRNAWHGNGYNRWFDKPVQFFVSKNASSGFLGEHSKMDGTPTLAMNDAILKEVIAMSAEEFGRTTSPASYEELQFVVDPATDSAIQKELAQFNSTVNTLDINVWQYFGVGKNQIKQFKMSPDAFIQMVLQLAYFKYTGTLRPTYESATTRKYFGGRTETCRTVSLEALQFVRDWENPSVPNTQKIASLRSAVSVHVSYIKKATEGLGVDRHLLGLSQMLKTDEATPAIFRDPMYAYSQHWYLSTSQLSCETFNGYGWAPVVPEGFGLAYMLNQDWCHVNITVYKNNPMGLRADVMAYYLTQAMNEMREVLSTEVKPKL